MKLDVDGQPRHRGGRRQRSGRRGLQRIKTLVPHEAKLELYQVHAVTQGTDAQAEVSVRLSQDGRAMTRRPPIPTRWWRPPRPISARSTRS